MKICIVKLSALGDIVHAMVVLQFLKEKIPNSQIDWIVEEGFKSILENSPHIDNILTVNLKSLKSNKLNIFKEFKQLKKYSQNNYDLLIDAQGLLKSAIASKIIGAKKIIGFSKESIRERLASSFYDETVSIGYEKNVIERNIKVICSALNVNVDRQDILNKDAFLYSSHHEKNNTDIIFVVGASRENKIYPKEKFLELALELKAYKIEVIWASKFEKDVALFLEENAENVKVCDKMSLDALKNKIKNTKLVIGGDTGPTHMAWGLNVASIAIFGNTPEYRNTYITEINQVVKSNSKVNPLKIDKNDFSIGDIEVKEIVDLADELLSKV